MTRLYLHNALNALSGTFPTTEQSSKTSTVNFEAQTVNRSMNTTIGTSQASLTFVNTTVRNDEFGYVSKFVSEPLNMTSITAQTWTWNFAAKISAGAPINAYPTPSTSDNLPVSVYVWRPSTGAKVLNIFDGNTSTTGYDVGFENNLNEVNEQGTFSGAAVTSQVGDVIIIEIWVRIDAVSTTSATLSIFYDGTTVNTSASGTTVTSHASFLETPQTLTFTAPTIDMTQSAAKTYSNKFITKV